jgi:hypothetical protein
MHGAANVPESVKVWPCGPVAELLFVIVPVAPAFGPEMI